MWQAHTFHLSFSIGSSGGHSYFVPLLGFGAGVGLFANGFWNYRKLRVIEDTPRIPVRSTPMGLVHVHGKVMGKFLLTSPVARIPCYYYHVRLECWQEQGKNRGWHTVHTEKDQRTFYVEDGTGKVLINPQSAEYDLPSTYCAEIGPRRTPGLTSIPLSVSRRVLRSRSCMLMQPRPTARYSSEPRNLSLSSRPNTRKPWRGRTR